jgi:hypothetical protein
MTPAELIRLECIGAAMRLFVKPFHLMCGAGNLVPQDVGQRVSAIVGPIFEQGVRE